MPGCEMKPAENYFSGIRFQEYHLCIPQVSWVNVKREIEELECFCNHMIVNWNEFFTGWISAVITDKNSSQFIVYIAR